MKYFVIVLVLIGSSGLIIPQTFGAYVEFDDNNYRLFLNNKHVVDFQLNWSSEDYPGGKITFDEPINETILLQIPKNMPRNTNLDFGSGLYAIQTDGSWEEIRETESNCFYILEIPVNNSDYIEIESASVAAGRWELVTMQNEECDNVLSPTRSIFPFHGNYVWQLPPLKQIKSGVSLTDVKCTDGKYAVYKYNRMRVACVSEETQSELWDRGWATMRFYTEEDTSSHALCNNYKGKWHPEYEGCRDITELQCSLMGGEFVDGLKICYDEICPVEKTYTLCVTNPELIPREKENEE